MTAPVRILLVDDETAFVETLAKRLGHLGASVRTAEGGIEAYAILESEPMDVVLLDMHMPDLNGLETLKIIRKNFPATEVILLTGEGDMTRHMQCLEAGAFDFLLKPVPLERLWKRILDAVGS
ncbi:response regulator [uncultured Pseudodesulfovibrio sp.]|uniref:response regulator n=1 Tax=uncultured Pseudodesulfovibrio sp. TaxID=2035858 RepID=UPI0029C6CB77|nr:response regulator [uncultured Pseudodesulfovibrio sp.]